jgi:response regulator NasT
MSNTIRVMLVDDHAVVRSGLSAFLMVNPDLELVGEAEDGLRTVIMVRELLPQVVVMDIKMPNLDGLSAAEKIADLKIPVVLLTAFSQQELVTRAAEVGAMAFLVKPFTPQDLMPAIEIALSRHLQLVALEIEVSDLAERLETRKLVERAKGVLSEKMKLTEPEAFRWIQKASMDRRLSMADVARTVLDQLEK